MKIKIIKKKIEKDGFVIIKNIINKNQVNKILKEMELTFDYCVSLSSKKKVLKSFDQKYMWLQKKHNKLKSRAYDISQLNQSMFKTIFSKKLQNITKNYFGKSPLVDYPEIKFQDNLNKRLQPIHQDIYGTLSSKSLIAWVALTKVSKFYGTLNLIKGSHKMGILKSKFYKSNGFKAHGTIKNLYKNLKITHINIKSGDGVLFHPLLLHGSSKNFSKKIRINYIVRFADISGINYLNNLNCNYIRKPQF